MRYRSLLVLPVLLSLGAAAPQGDAAKKGQERFQGTWRVLRAEDRGVVMVDEKAGRMFDVKLVIKGNRIHYTGNLPGLDLEFTYKLDPTKSPKVIEMTLVKSGDKKGIGETTKGIYVLEGDSLKICGSPQELPKEFDGKKYGLFVLKRLKE